MVAALPAPLPEVEALLRNTVTGSPQTFGESPLSLLPLSSWALPSPSGTTLWIGQFCVVPGKGSGLLLGHLSSAAVHSEGPPPDLVSQLTDQE